MTPEEQAKLDLVNTIKGQVTEIVNCERDAQKGELKAINEKLSALASDVTLKEEVVRLAAELKAFKEAPKENEKISLKDELKSNKETLKSIAKGSNEEIQLKALSARSTITGNQMAYDLPDIGQLATRKLSMYDVFPKLQIGAGNTNGTIRYYDWDENTIARASAAVAEGAVFPESTAKFKIGTITLQKIGDTLPITEEFFEDEQMFAAELGMFLDTNVKLEIDRQLMLGDGTGNTLTGLVASVPAFAPVASGITDASIYDLIIKVSEAITNTGGAKYSPDIVLMNIVDINKMKLKKDANKNYVMPPFVSRDGQQVGSINVIESNITPANTCVLGDRRFGKIYEMGDVVISKGLVNAQFTADELTLKARKRIAFLVRSADKGAFKAVTSISAALTTLAT